MEDELKGKRLQIFTFPNPILKKKGEKVTEFNNELKELCEDMIFTMYDAPGIGLAAPQVGVSKRIFVIDTDFEREEVTKSDDTIEYTFSDMNPQIFINPIIKNKEGEIETEEGCLSVPGIFDKVKRAEKITVEYQDIDGKEQTLETEGTLAVCIQHENDHLDGIMFIDRLSFMKKNLYTQKLIKRKKRLKAEL